MDWTDAVNANLFTVNMHFLTDFPSPPHSGIMNSSSEEEEGGGHGASSTIPTSTSTGPRQATASERAQRDPRWYAFTVDLSSEGEDTAYDISVDEGVRPHHHSSGWSQDSTTPSTTDIDHEHIPLSSLSRRSLH